MGNDIRSIRRRNRAEVLKALHDETGGWGGDAAEARAKNYCKDPGGAATMEFAYVGALTLRRFYIDPDKPNGVEQAGLWKNIQQRLSKDGANPGGWDDGTNVSQLQIMAEEAA